MQRIGFWPEDVTAEQRAEATRVLNVSRGTMGFERVGRLNASELALVEEDTGHEIVLRGPRSWA